MSKARAINLCSRALVSFSVFLPIALPMYSSAADRANPIELSNTMAKCPSDKKSLEKLIVEFEDREFCSRSSPASCKIWLGAAAGGAGAAAAAVAAKRVAFFGDAKAPKLKLKCGGSASLSIPWIERAWAAEVCRLGLPSAKDSMKEYLRRLQEITANNTEELKARSQAYLQEGRSIASRYGSTPAVTEAVKPAVFNNAKFEEDYARKLNDPAKMQSIKKYLSDWANGTLETQNYTPEERKEVTRFHQSFNDAKANFERNVKSMPTTRVVTPATSGLAEKRIDSILARPAKESESALAELAQLKATLKPEDYAALKETIQARATIDRSLVDEATKAAQLARSGLEVLKPGTVVNAKFLESIPSVSNLDPDASELRNYIAMSVDGADRIHAPHSGFAMLRLGGVNRGMVARNAADMVRQGALRMGSAALQVGKGVASMPAGLAMASGNNDMFAFNIEKKCIAESASELVEIPIQFVDFDDNCNSQIARDSEKFENFLRLPTANKVDFLSNNLRMRAAYCPLLLKKPLNSVWRIQCESKSSINLQSRNGDGYIKVDWRGGDPKVEVSNSFRRNYNCASNYSYDHKLGSFRGSTTSAHKKCETLTASLNESIYEYTQALKKCDQPDVISNLPSREAK